jgi:hypothetical protein
MRPADNEFDSIKKLRTLQSVNPQKAMDQIEMLIQTFSVQELAQTLTSVYREVTQDLGIDWHFTALQWKIGNSSAQEFSGAFPGARLKVWCFPLVDESKDASEERYATCLPFQFQKEWEVAASAQRRLDNHPLI